MKKNFLIYLKILIVALVSLNSCKKDDNKTVINPTNDKTTGVFNQNKTYGTVTDYDGNVYKTISIGTQTWMAENLRTIHYRNGESIPHVTDNTMWINLSSDAYSIFNNSIKNDTIATFGGLYNWYATTDSRNLAPIGWHIPSDADWKTLTDYLGGESIAGGKMKESGITHWISPNSGATNESGFTAIPGNCRSIDAYGAFGSVGYSGNWWSSTSDVDNLAWGRKLDNYKPNVGRFYFNMRYGLSIRCIRD